MTTQATTFSQIRSLLDNVERAVVAIRSEPAKAPGVVRDVEQIEALLDNLRSARVDTRAEDTRAESLRARLDREAELVVRQVEKSGQAESLAASALWQELRATVATRRAASVRRWMFGGAALLLGALLLFVVLPRVFPMPRVANTLAVSRLVAEGDLEGALELARTEQANAPDDLVIGVWIVALEQQLGNLPQGEEAWAEVRTRYNDDVSFLTDRVAVLLEMGNIDGAERDALALQTIPGGEALGAYQLGSVREVQGRTREAIAAFEQASTIANEQNRPELVAAARARMATLMQQPQ